MTVYVFTSIPLLKAVQCTVKTIPHQRNFIANTLYMLKEIYRNVYRLYMYYHWF